MAQNGPKSPVFTLFWPFLGRIGRSGAVEGRPFERPPQGSHGAQDPPFWGPDTPQTRMAGGKSGRKKVIFP